MAYMPHAFQVHVGAAKAGIDMMMKNLAIEWGRHGIRTNSIVPGPIEGTEGMKRLSSSREEFINAIPLRRMGTVDDIGQTAVFLASPLASYISGCVVVVRRWPEPGRLGALQHRCRADGSRPVGAGHGYAEILPMAVAERVAAVELKRPDERLRPVENAAEEAVALMYRKPVDPKEGD